MIKITIEKTVCEDYKEQENLIVKRTPTEHREKGRYDESEKVVFAEEFAPRELTKRRCETVKILEQQIENDADFNFADVIKAINNL